MTPTEGRGEVEGYGTATLSTRWVDIGTRGIQELLRIGADIYIGIESRERDVDMYGCKREEWRAAFTLKLHLDIWSWLCLLVYLFLRTH